MRGQDALRDLRIARRPRPQPWAVDSGVYHKLLYPLKPVYHVVPKQEFRVGQAIIQWWAHWMVDAQQPPSQIKQKSRPSWYVGKVLLEWGYGPIRYGGVENKPSWLYRVY